MISFKKFCAKIFRVGCIGFGGGNALVPVFESVFFKDNSLPESAAVYDRDVIVANITPGALPVELSGALGRHNYGVKGMLTGPVLFTLPGLIGASILFLLLTGMQEQFINYINVAAVGIAAFIIALLTDYIRNVFRKKKQEKMKAAIPKTIIIMAAVAIFSCGSTIYKLFGLDCQSYLSVSTINVLLAAFFLAFWVGKKKDFWHIAPAVILVGIFFLGTGKAEVFASVPIVMYIDEILMVILGIAGIVTSVKGKNIHITVDKKRLFGDLGIWVLFAAVLSVPAFLLNPEIISFLGRDMLSTVLSFGGGDAYLTIADGMFVDSGIIPEDTFYSQIITVVNVLPGSILCKTLYGVGYYVGLNATGSIAVGILTGIAGFACSVAASCMAFFTMYYFYDGLIEIPGFAIISKWIRPIVGGLLIKVMLSLLAQGTALSDTFGINLFVILAFSLALSALNILAKDKQILGNVLIILIDIALALAFFLLV